jgi:hypothetical protein
MPSLYREFRRFASKQNENSTECMIKHFHKTIFFYDIKELFATQLTVRINYIKSMFRVSPFLNLVTVIHQI